MIAIFPEICAETDPCRVARLTRQYFIEKPHSIKPDLESMIQRCGLQLSFQNLGDPDTKAILAVKDHKGTFEGAILIQSQTSPSDTEFLITHCLGRYFLKILPAIARGDFKTSGYRISDSPLNSYIQQKFSDIDEQQATRFSSELLLPEDKVRKAFKKINDPQSLSKFFRIDFSYMQRRLCELGLITLPTNFHHSEISQMPLIPKPTLPPQAPQNTPTLRRIRALAQRIDHTVKT